MSQFKAERKLIEVLAEQFITRYRRGERPALSEYISAHPELADEIRELFPTLVMIEELAPDDSGLSAPATAASSQPPHLSLGDYRLIREIGRGGMGVVYEAEQVSLGRRVALKVLPRHTFSDVALRQRFYREARAAAQLHHTNIVPVYEVGEDQDVCWYAMQLILGQGLDQIIEELRQLPPSRSEARPPAEPPAPPTGQARVSLSQVTHALVSGRFDCPGADAAMLALALPHPLSLAQGEREEQASLNPTDSTRLANRTELSAVDSAGGQYYRSVARIGRQVAEALAHAHARGIIHRDVKPSNLLLHMAGIVWITDFGVAKTGGKSLTTTGDIVGTLRYMAPERFKGECDERTDIYGLGLTLYELLVLRPALVEHDQLRLIDAIKNEEPLRPRAVDRHIPRDLETIVLKAINKDPTRRYSSAEAVAEDLRCFLTSEPIKARRTSEWERLRMWGRRNPALAVLSAALLVLLILIAAATTATTFYLQATLEVSEKHRERAEKAELDSQHKLWLSYLRQAQSRRMSRQSGQHFASLRAIKAALDLPVPPDHSRAELRTEAIACLALPDVCVAQEWDGWPAGSAHLDFDSTLERYVRTDDTGGVNICRVGDGVLLAHFMSDLRKPVPQLSSDGRFLALCASSRCELWKLDDPKPILFTPQQDCVAFDFSPNGQRAALVHPDGTIRVYGLSADRPVQLLKAGPHPVSFVAFHRDNRRLALSHSGGVQIRDLDSAETPIHLSQTGAERLAWHPAGRMLAVVGRDLAIHLWDVTARQEIRALQRWKNGGLQITFNHAGDLLASYGWEHMIRLWDPLSGHEIFHTPARFEGMSLRFSPDDRILAADIKDGKLNLWKINLSLECRRLLLNPSQGKAPFGPFAVHPDGRILASCTPDGFGLWHMRTREQLLDCNRLGPLDNVLFEPSGALLTSGPCGTFRWPLQPDPAPADTWRLGPPQRLALPPTSRTQLACSLDGQVLASADGEGGWVLRSGRPASLIRLKPHKEARAIAVSPNGRYVVTGSQQGSGARVWDARTGRLEKELISAEEHVRVRFSPDGRWLAGRGNGLWLWEVGSWRERIFLAGVPEASFAFSPVEKLLAMETGQGALRLMDPETGREYARLEEPDQVKSAWICFSPDGTQLLTLGGGGDAWIRVWDLRAIRRQLVAMELDWDLPAYPPSSDSKDAAPIRVILDRGGLPEQPLPETKKILNETAGVQEKR
jgi:serine/threonine protein kinase/WD40 repeat protein